MDGQSSSKADELEGSGRANLLAVYKVISDLKTMGMLGKAAVDAARTILIRNKRKTTMLCKQKSSTGTLQLEPANLVLTRRLIQMYETVYSDEWSSSFTIEARWRFILENAGTTRVKMLRGISTNNDNN